MVAIWILIFPYIDKVAWARLANPSGGTTAGKKLETLAGEVQKGIWGNGADRQKGLGNLFNAVQAIINHRANGDAGTAVKVLAEEVKAGRLGNGDTRKILLGSYYTLVQNFINGNTAQPQAQYYTVQAGDTLSGIAAKYGTTWQNLQQLNSLSF